MRNIFIPLSYEGPRLRMLQRGDVIWTRESEGYHSAYTKRTLSHVEKRNDEIRLYWSDGHYLLAVDPTTAASRVFLVEDEERLFHLVKQSQHLFKCS